jgi:hypothetical protein
MMSSNAHCLLIRRIIEVAKMIRCEGRKLFLLVGLNVFVLRRSMNWMYSIYASPTGLLEVWSQRSKEVFCIAGDKRPVPVGDEGGNVLSASGDDYCS